jgi:hypothetical protein
VIEGPYNRLEALGDLRISLYVGLGLPHKGVLSCRLDDSRYGAPIGELSTSTAVIVVFRILRPSCFP